MPGSDRTGPLGYGPQTGRGMGICAGYASAGRFVRGCGMGFGGRGYRNRFWTFSPRYLGGVPQPEADVSAQQKLSSLKQQAEFLHNELDEINQRIEQLEKTIAE